MIKIFDFIGRKCFSVFALVLALCLCLPQMSFANPKVDTDHVCSLELIYQYNGKPIEGASFQLYFVADVSENMTFDLEDDFEASGISLFSVENDDKWAKIASTLHSYISLENAEGIEIRDVAEGVTNSEGKLDFSNLETGMYLLTGEPVTIGNVEYDPVDTLITLPHVNDDNSLDYNPTIYPKEVTVTENDKPSDDTPSNDTPSNDTPTTQSTYLNVVKIWSDTGYESSRPSSVTVVLMQDGKKYDTVVLSKDNNWRYRWENLSKDSTWELAEESVPTNYSVTVVKDGNSFIVTNTRKKPSSSSGTKRNEGSSTTTTTTESTTATEGETEATTEKVTEVTTEKPNNSTPKFPFDSFNKNSDDSTEVETDEYGNIISDMDRYGSHRDPDETTEATTDGEYDSNTDDDVPSGSSFRTTGGSKTGGTGTSSSGKLPQTGQLWWPVSFGLIAGLILLMAGIIVSDDKAEEVKSQK